MLPLEIREMIYVAYFNSPRGCILSETSALLERRFRYERRMRDHEGKELHSSRALILSCRQM